MPGQFLWSAGFALMIALLLSEAFPGRPPAPGPATELRPPPAPAREAPAACRETRKPLLDAGGGLTLAC